MTKELPQTLVEKVALELVKACIEQEFIDPVMPDHVAYTFAEAALSALPIMEMVEILEHLVELKDYKDKHGKDADYVARQQLAWQDARDVLKKLQEELK